VILATLIKKRYTSKQLFLESSRRAPGPPHFLGAHSLGKAFSSLERRVRCVIAVIENIVHEALEPLGFEVLEVVVSGGKRSSLVLVRMDRLDEQPVTTTDLERMLGLKAKVKVLGVGGFVGKIVEVTPEAVTLEGDAQERRSFPLAGIVANLAEFPDRHR
jgi:ribosome maturation factor RimP